MNGSPDTQTALQAAQARIAATRLALRAELVARPEPGAGGAPRSSQPSWRRWRRQLRRWPLAGVALQALQGWWRQHPLQPASQLLAQQVSTRVAPLVRRHPAASMAAAAVLGGLLVSARPWRWPAFGAVFRPLPGQAGRLLQDLLGNPVLQAGLAGWLATLLRDTDEARPASQPAQEGP